MSKYGMSEVLEVVLHTYLYKVMSHILDSVRVSLKWHLVKLFHRHSVPLEDALYGRQAYSIDVVKYGLFKICSLISRILIALLAKTIFIIAVSCTSVNKRPRPP